MMRSRWTMLLVLNELCLLIARWKLGESFGEKRADACEIKWLTATARSTSPHNQPWTRGGVRSTDYMSKHVEYSTQLFVSA
jgi:hypothetical protein